MVVLVLDVVVDVDLDRLDIDEAVGVARQRPEGGFVQLLEGLAVALVVMFALLTFDFAALPSTLVCPLS